MSKISTRSVTKHSHFGKPTKFPVNQLPTKTDVYRHYLHVRKNLPSSAKANPSVRDVCKSVLTDLTAVWKRASIPTVTENSLLKRLVRLVEEANKLTRYQHNRTSSAAYSDLRANFDKLFDICSCKCVERKITDRGSCKCKNKVPATEWEFWLDQKNNRKLFIGAVDVAATKKLKKRAARQESREATRKKQCIQQAPAEESSVEYDVSSGLDEHSDVSMAGQQSEDSDFGLEKSHNTFQYKELSEIMERTGVSNRDACKIVNACMKDLGFVSPMYLLDPAKLRRQRKYWREVSTEQHTTVTTN